MPPKSGKSYSLEKRSVFASALIISFVIIIGLAGLVAYNTYTTGTDHVIRANDTRANLITKIVLEHERAAIGVIRSYANRPLLVDSVKRKDIEGVGSHLTSLVKNNPEVQAGFITDPGGTLWANIPIYKEALNQNLSYRDWYKGVSKEWRPYVSSVYRMIVGEKDLAVAVCSPIFDEKGKIIGILGATQPADFFGEIISEIGIEGNAKVTLIDQEGHIIYSNRFPYTKEVIDYPTFDFVRKVMQGEKGNTEIRDSSDANKSKYVSFEPIQGIGWSVIVEKTKNEIIRSAFPYFILIFAVTLLILVFITFSLLYLRGRHKQIKALRESEGRLQLLTSQLLTAQEIERKRVAHELHDSIGAFLSGIKIQIENVILQLERGTATPDSLKKVVPTVQHAIEESRRIQMNLRPSILDDLGILPTLDWHCREFQKTHSHIRIEKQIDVTEDKVPHSLKIVIYRISQEALNNIFKHSKADQVTLSLRKTGDPIELAIRDNGRGFDVQEALSKIGNERGLGLSSMRERVELTGGSFSIESAQGAGTVIRAVWPTD
jgi:signal transduction histidine kinase